MESLLQLIHDIWKNLQSGQLPNLGYWDYVLLALFVAIEGPIATLLGAAAASAGLLHLDLVFVSASTGNLTSDTLWYYLGYAGKIEWLAHYGRWFGVRRHHLDRLKQGMHDHAPKILLVAKLTAGFVIPALIAAGLARIPWRRWFPPILTGEVVWTGSLVLIGYYATEAIKQVEHDVRYVVPVASGFFVLALLLWLVRPIIRHIVGLNNSNGNNQDTREG